MVHNLIGAGVVAISYQPISLSPLALSGLQSWCTFQELKESQTKLITTLQTCRSVLSGNELLMKILKSLLYFPSISLLHILPPLTQDAKRMMYRAQFPGIGKGQNYFSKVKKKFSCYNDVFSTLKDDCAKFRKYSHLSLSQFSYVQSKLNPFLLLARSEAKHYKYKFSSENRLLLVLMILNGFSSKSIEIIFGVTNSYICKECYYIIPLIGKVLGPELISMENFYNSPYTDSIFGSFGSTDNYHCIIFRPPWDLHAPYYRADKGYNIATQVTINHFGRVCHFFSGVKGSTNDNLIRFMSGLPFEKPCDTPVILVDGGYIGQAGHQILWINPDYCKKAYTVVHEALQKFLRVAIEIRIGKIDSFGIFSKPMKFNRKLVPSVVYACTVLSELDVMENPIRTAEEIEDFISVLKQKYNILSVQQ